MTVYEVMADIAARIAGGGALDPAFSWALRLLLAAIFARAAFGKLRIPSQFADALSGYDLVPASLVRSLAAALLATECILVPALLTPVAAPMAAMVAGGVMCLYTAAIAINLARGRRDIDCGCAGPTGRQALHEMLVTRNLVYVGFAICAALPVSARTLTALDGLTIASTVVCLFALAVATDGLTALAARTKIASTVR